MASVVSWVVDEFLTDNLQREIEKEKNPGSFSQLPQTDRQCQVKNVIHLLDQDLTIPYIARYRKHETGSMEAGNIRKVQEIYEKYKNVKIEAEKVIKKVGKEASEEFISNIRSAKSIEDIQELYAPFKKKRKGTLAERAQSLGLDAAASEILRYPEKELLFKKYLHKSSELATELQIKTGIMHILAHQISLDSKVKEILEKEIKSWNIFLSTKASQKGIENDNKKLYENYYKFSSLISRLYSHQIMAINRAEHQKVLSVKLEIKEECRQTVINKIIKLQIPNKCSESFQNFILETVNDAFVRLIEKSFLLRTRTKLTKSAEKESLDVFTQNLKHLYLVAPVKNKFILSIDPGFKNGCKIALLDKNGSVLETCVIFPFKTKKDSTHTLLNLIKKYQVEVVALGNGTACRETEQFISDLIKEERLVNLHYCIVCESGASVYSVTDEAKLEFGDMDPNLISAVSIGRRLQDPLLELIKINAKHTGVGMYQHDINTGLLNSAVNAVIEDCVSFIGVDINACSARILRCVSGINKKQADAIIEYRNKHGGFINREELKSIKGIGPVTYRNCAGFVRVNVNPKNAYKAQKVEDVDANNSSSSRKRKQKMDDFANKKSRLAVEPLDRTWIHPELYPLTYNLLGHLGVSSSLIGSHDIKSILDKKVGTDEQFQRVLDVLQTDREVLKLVLEGLTQPFDFDPREGFEIPIFKTGLTSIAMLTVGCSVSGAVRNCTSFGVFVDIGVESDALIPNRYMLPNILVGPGDRVECTVLSIEMERKRISLSLTKKLSLELCLQ